MSKYFCKLIGKSCLEKDCAQHNSIGGCKLYKMLGIYLYQAQSLVGLAQFIKYLTDEVRPEVYMSVKESDGKM